MGTQKVFEPIHIGNVSIPNRIVMAPMDTNLATKDGFVTEQLIDYYVKRAAGGIGLVTVENTSVSSKRLLKFENSLAIHDDRYLEGLSTLARSIQKEGAKASLQLGDCLYLSDKKPEDLSVDEIEEIIADFVKAAMRVKQAGFDVVDFHMAHRYTLADFLSKYANRRTDSYGKNVAGRVKIAETIVKETKKELGDDVAIICRINGDEFMVGGNTLIDSTYISKKLVRAGAEAIHVSAGGRIEHGGSRSYSSHRQVATNHMSDGLNVHLAEEIKKHIDVPVITVGKIGTPALIEEIIEKGKADMVALGRATLADAEFVNKMRNNEKHKRCIWKNDCVRLYLRNEPVYCVTYDKK
ncbi:NADH:flavin oxidoreductase [Halalkalibacter nanhaiisediminis]|uniref:2,4-dienoyl-CoA reductase-like NADH-dependent reductase (Old Yellow Enzyme family) n=1 Tax=Halalkalibacter nanhaiisediminis TaxID=688079 RepID=A0A562QD93_9BACI|nr:NADH:flavin oxidoreductase [Halalkalibacter nanhaiisediminis]TWI54721.1 2,4-dienoyl-CoA reductase-like NADH-dependent reductase (Old Yellow Enzyme family) [Halalkalibacter nanhaiisediminis]